MDEGLVRQIEQNFEAKTTPELLAIWNDAENEELSDEAFEAVRRLLESRGHSSSTKGPRPSVAKQMEKFPPGPMGNIYVCTECYSDFELIGVPRLSFFGFDKLTCPECGKVIKYPLTQGHRSVYSVLVIVGVLALVLAFLDGRAAFLGGMWGCALGLIVTDKRRQERVRRAWAVHFQRANAKVAEEGPKEKMNVG